MLPRAPYSITDITSVDWEVVTCPAELVAKTGCSVTGYKSADALSAPASSPAAPVPAPSSIIASAPPASASSVSKSSSGESTIESPPTNPKAAAPNNTSTLLNVQSSASLQSNKNKTVPAHPHWNPSASKKEEGQWKHSGQNRWVGEEEEGEHDDCDA